jgi:hypothetical protein
MTRSKSEIKNRIKKNASTVYDDYPYVIGAVVLVSLCVGIVIGVLI